MVLFFENGRIGNLLFQYSGIKKYFPNEVLVFFGCETLQKYFDNIEAQFFSRVKINKWILYGLLKRIIFFLAEIKIFGKITENTNSINFKIIVKRGLFYNILVVRDVFFQHDDIINNISIHPKLKEHLLEKPKEWFKKKKINFDLYPLVFVHIRRGDYLYWPSKKYSAVLSLHWYKMAMNEIKKKFQNPIFILMSDDQYYLKENFKESEKIVISDNSLETDLAIMSKCNCGILSASSFSWWGAFYAFFNKKNNQYFIGPKFWAGHQKKKWYPKNIQTKWITYIE